MRLLSRRRSFDEQQADEREAHLAGVREARVKIARAADGWTELDEVDVVVRNPFFVAVSTDQFFVRHAGVVFDPRSASVIATNVQLHFFVDQQGGLVFLERCSGTWSERLEGIEQRRLRAT